MKKILQPCLYLFIFILSTSCTRQAHTYKTTIRTDPAGADVMINGTSMDKQTPFDHIFNFTSINEYNVTIKKDGYFHQEQILTETSPDIRKGKIEISLSSSPLWQATAPSPATNNWLQILPGTDFNTDSAWKILKNTVIKYSEGLSEVNDTSKFLQTSHIKEKFHSDKGYFFLRGQIIATIVSREPLIYKIKDITEWSKDEVQWYPYTRSFLKHSQLVEEAQERLR